MIFVVIHQAQTTDMQFNFRRRRQMGDNPCGVILYCVIDAIERLR